MSDSVEAAQQIRQAYKHVFTSENGKTVLNHLKRTYLEGKICLGGEDTIRRGAEHDLVQTIVSFIEQENTDG